MHPCSCWPRLALNPDPEAILRAAYALFLLGLIVASGIAAIALMLYILGYIGN